MYLDIEIDNQGINKFVMVLDDNVFKLENHFTATNHK